MSDAFTWWNNYFPLDKPSDKNILPLHTKSENFWNEYFPPMKLLLNSIQNSDQFWRKVQKVITCLTYSDVPCPFLQYNMFISKLYSLKEKLSYNTINNVITFLELVPRVSEPYNLLWVVPPILPSPSFYFDLLISISEKDHWIWIDFLSYEGSVDLFFDYMLPLLEPNIHLCDYNTIKLIISAIQLVTNALITKPGNISHLSESIYKIFSKFILIFSSSSPTVGYYALKSCLIILDRLRFAFTSEKYGQYIITLIKKVRENDYFVIYTMNYLRSILVGDHFLATAALEFLSKPKSAEEIDYAFQFINKFDSGKSEEISKAFLILCINDKVFSNTALSYLLNLLDRCDESRWIYSFLQKCTHFAIMAKYNSKYNRKTEMIVNLFKTLANSNQEWVKRAISKNAAYMLASSLFPINIVSLLDPDPFFDKKIQNSLMKSVHSKVIKDLLDVSIFKERKTKIDTPNVLQKQYKISAKKSSSNSCCKKDILIKKIKSMDTFSKKALFRPKCLKTKKKS